MTSIVYNQEQLMSSKRFHEPKQPGIAAYPELLATLVTHDAKSFVEVSVVGFCTGFCL